MRCGISWAVAAALLGGGTALAQDPQDRCATFSQNGLAEAIACFEGEVDRYGHQVLGDTPEFETLVFKLRRVDETLENVEERVGSATLPFERVFEDIAPRLADLTGDGLPEVIVIEADQNAGAQLAVYGFNGDEAFDKVAATPFIGIRNRWLAPAGFADFNSDGRLDVAYVQTPHIGGILRIWTLRDREMIQLASRSGLSNHRIGQAFIPGGVRDCGDGPEVVTADQTWRNTVASWLRDDGEIASRTIAEDASLETLERAVACEIDG